MIAMSKRFVIGGLITVLAACAEQAERAPAADVLARVYGVEITAHQLDEALEILYPGTNRPDNARRRSLQRLIDFELLVKEAKARGLDNDIQVTTIVELTKRDLLLAELYNRDILKRVTKVSTEEARQYFEGNRFGEERRLSRILVPSSMAAQRIRRRLDDGEDFAVIASEVSLDPKTAAEGGDLGWLSPLSTRYHLLRRNVFSLPPGEAVGPIQDKEGFSFFLVTDVRKLPYESIAEPVQKALIAHKNGTATLYFLSDLADRTDLRLDDDVLGMVLGRFADASVGMPEFGKGEGRKTLLTAGGDKWTVQHFMAAMLSERDQAEIKSLEDLRLYVRRLYALKVLLPRRGTELGLDEAEAVQRGVENTLREALIDRLRKVVVDEKIELSQDDLLAYYERYRARYARSERITILEVLLETRQETEELLDEIEAGEDLAELAGRYSVRSSRVRQAGGRIQLMRPDKYGRLGWEAKEAEIGEVVGPVKSTQGYSVFEVLKKVPGQQYNFEESRIRVTGHLRQERINAGAAALVERLNDKYSEGIQLFETHLQAAGGV
jgi:peptidyl-prolyl cis-trans isomerase C